MKLNFLAGVIGTALILSPLGWAQRQDGGQGRNQARENSGDMGRAIAFQRAKDRADQRQTRLEERHPSVNYSNADRRMDDSSTDHRVVDPGERQSKKDKN